MVFWLIRDPMRILRCNFIVGMTLVACAAFAEEPAALFQIPDVKPTPLVPVESPDLPTWLGGTAEDPSSVMPISQAVANLDPSNDPGVVRIPSYLPRETHGQRMVRYEVPLKDTDAHSIFVKQGFSGRLLSIEKESVDERSSGERIRGFFSPEARRREAEMVQVVRYEVPAEDIRFHASVQAGDGPELVGQIIEPGFMPIPEVRFFQPKARVFMDLKNDNDSEFDLFADGAILASLDVIELYFPMPLISERFGELLGNPSQLSSLGWRVGGTVGLGIATALNNGTENGSAPVTTLSSGIRYEFPLGRPSREVLETRDLRLDQRTRVGIEFGVQGGISTHEALNDKTDIGMYFGFQVDTPWGS